VRLRCVFTVVICFVEAQLYTLKRKRPVCKSNVQRSKGYQQAPRSKYGVLVILADEREEIRKNRQQFSTSRSSLPLCTSKSLKKMGKRSKEGAAWVKPDFDRRTSYTLLVRLLACKGFCAQQMSSRKLVPCFSHSRNRPRSCQTLLSVLSSGCS
jgi:hypothetical protein